MTHPPHNRILHVPRRFVAEEWGGTETVILEISRQQQRAGGRPEILTSMALATRREEQIGGVPVRRFPYSYPFLGLSRADRAAMDKKGGNLLSFSLFKSLLLASEVRLFHAHALKRLGGEVRTAARLRRMTSSSSRWTLRGQRPSTIGSRHRRAPSRSGTIPRGRALSSRALRDSLLRGRPPWPSSRW